MAFKVTEFTASGLPLGGARPNLFTVIVDTPNGVPNIGARISFTCRAAALPESEIEKIEVGYFGRKIKLAGNRKFEDWETTILNDEDFQVRHALETWSNAINSHQNNLRAAQLATPAQYRTTALVTHYGKTGAPLRTYKFINIWPANIQKIALDWNTPNTIEEFVVTWAYDYWQPDAPGTTGTFSV